MASTDSSIKGNLLHRIKSQKQYKKITDSKEYKDADYVTKNKMLREGGSKLPERYGSTFKKGGTAKLKGGGMSQRGLGKAFKKGGRA